MKGGMCYVLYYGLVGKICITGSSESSIGKGVYKMKGKWTTTQLMVVAGLAVVDVVVEFINSIITASTRPTLASGIITGISEPLLLMVGLLLIRRFGAGILFIAIVSVLTLPIDYAHFSGFIAKVPFILALGVICDLLFLGLKKANSYFTGFIIGAVFSLWYVTFIAFNYNERLFELLGNDTFLLMMPLSALILIVSIISGIGGSIGVVVYSRISKTSGGYSDYRGDNIRRL